MKQISRLILIILLVFSFSLNVNADNNNVKDSLKVSKIVTDFFNWYIGAIKEKKYSEYQPIFTENKREMTALDYSDYFKNLKEYNFSKLLIKKEKKSYNECKKSIEKIKFSDFQNTIFKDLDEYEVSNCDFSNNYRWIGGQEICDGITINYIEFNSKDKCVATIWKYTDNGILEKQWWSDIVTIYLLPERNKWKIRHIRISK